MDKIKNIISKPWVIVLLFVTFSVIASTQSLLRAPKQYAYAGENFVQTHYNNYVIFKSSFHHLCEGKDLYTLYLNEHWDLFKYTPTFATFFGIFASLPDWLGLNLWNLLNVLVLALAVYYLPKVDNLKKGLILLICAIEMITSIQNSQSNALIAGLMILTFGLLENKKYIWATLCVAISAYIKLFGILGFALFLMYPNKVKSMAYSVLWMVILFVVPLLFVDIQQYGFLLSSFGNMLSNDHSASYGFSVLGWLNTWFGWQGNKFVIVAIGGIFFMIPFLFTQRYTDTVFRYNILSSLLIWMVIFNHKAESPTFVIAMAGVAIWFVMSPKNWANYTLLVLAFVFTSLSPTDIFPKTIRDNIVNPYCLKGVACIAVWLKINIDFYIEYFKSKASLQVNDNKE